MKRRKATKAMLTAAPELYECVKGFCDSWGAEVDRGDDISGSDAVEWICGAMLEFQIALAKAEGRA